VQDYHYLNKERIRNNYSLPLILNIVENISTKIVMFFKLTNSLAMFQIIINKILRDLVNTGKVVSFIDNVIIGTEEEE